MKAVEHAQKGNNCLNRPFLRKVFGAAFFFFLAKGVVWLCIFAGLLKSFA